REGCKGATDPLQTAGSAWVGCAGRVGKRMPRSAEAGRGWSARVEAIQLFGDDRPRHVRVHVAPEEVAAGGQGRNLVDAGPGGEDVALELGLARGRVRVDGHVVRGAVLVVERELERLAGRD